MTKSLTTRQSVLLLVMAMLSTKIQRMPAILSQEFGRNGWLYLLFTICIDLVMLLLILRVSVLTRGKTVHHALASRFGKPVAAVFSLVMALFFFVKILTPFRGTHEFFVSAIFDELNWNWFSVLFIVLLMFLACSGLNRLGRTAEILSLFVFIGFVGAMVLAVPTARFERILPIQMFSAQQFAKGGLHLTPWVADFMVVLFFVGRVKENKFKTAMTISFTLTALFVTFFCLTFYAIYDNLSTFPNVAISSITEFSLLSLSLGRIDWIIVMFAIASSVLSTGFFALIACEDFSEATSLPKKWVGFFIGVIIYVLDVFVFKNIEMFSSFFFKYYSWFTLVVNYGVPTTLWILFEIAKNKPSKYPYYPFAVRPKSLQELHMRQWNALASRQKPKYPLSNAVQNQQTSSQSQNANFANEEQKPKLSLLAEEQKAKVSAENKPQTTELPLLKEGQKQ